MNLYGGDEDLKEVTDDRLPGKLHQTKHIHAKVCYYMTMGQWIALYLPDIL
jgi:hypothetical protein